MNKWAKWFKEIWNSIQDEDRSDRTAMSSTPEMVDSINTLILSNRRITIEEIFD